MSQSFFLHRVLKWNSAYPIDINVTKLLLGAGAFCELCFMVLSFALGVKAQVELVLVQGFVCFVHMAVGSSLYYDPSFNHYKMMIVIEPFAVITGIVLLIFSRKWLQASQQLCEDIYSYAPTEYTSDCDSLMMSRTSFYNLLIVSVVIRILCFIASGIGTRKHRLLGIEALRQMQERKEIRERLKAQRTERHRRQKLLQRRELKEKVRQDLAALQPET